MLIDILVIKGILVDGEEVERYFFDEELFFVLVFKIMIDLFVGKLVFFRVYFGILELGFYVLNVIKNKRERIGCIL